MVSGRESNTEHQSQQQDEASAAKANQYRRHYIGYE
jgi:hypothetical protein